MIDTHSCEDKDALVGYLYGEIDADSRRAFEGHLRACVGCAREVQDLQAVRTELADWLAPEQETGVGALPAAAVVPLPAARQRGWEWAGVPMWARATAATVALGLGLGLANVRVQSGPDGMSISTGWLPAADAPAARPQAAAASPDWKPELAALETSLRREMESLRTMATPVAAHTGAAVSDRAVVERVQGLIEASERRQRQELALRLTQFGRDVEAQRRSDLVRIEQGFGRFEGRTGAEVARQRQLLDYLVRVSTKQVP